MSCAVSLPEEDLSCPVCMDIFSDPVLLSCSHSVCRSCLQRCWDASASRECPVCRCRAPKRSPPPCNLALKNLCEALVQSRRESHAGSNTLLCSSHGEKLKLFCLVDMQPVCVVCQSSKMHKHHECSPIEEAVLDCKNKICASLKTLKDSLDSLTRVPSTLKTMLAHIKSQAQETEQKMKDQFGQLHQFLYKEESAMLAVLRKEEEERRSLLMTAMTETAARTLSLTENITVLEKEIADDDLALLQNFKATLERSCVPQSSVTVSGTLIDVAKHLCNLKYRVWEKMSHHVGKAPVILDPNTAHPCLTLSDDLTSVHYNSLPLVVPDNPERFHLSAEVVGMTGLGSGSHSWEVETGSNEDWILGVVSESVPRTAEVLARPENGFWTLCLRNNEYRAMTSPPTPLAVARKPQRVRVLMDWDKGEVSFFDSTGHDEALYSFSQTKFTERVFPYFYTRSKHPLRILNDKKQCFG